MVRRSRKMYVFVAMLLAVSATIIASCASDDSGSRDSAETAETVDGAAEVRPTPAVTGCTDEAREEFQDQMVEIAEAGAGGSLRDEEAYRAAMLEALAPLCETELTRDGARKYCEQTAAILEDHLSHVDQIEEFAEGYRNGCIERSEEEFDQTGDSR